MEKFLVIGVFAMIIAAFLVAYERPAKSKKKITGRGGDFESQPLRFRLTYLEKEDVMGACQCGHTRDEEKNCDGTHKVVKAVKEDMAEQLAANGLPHASEYVKNN